MLASTPCADILSLRDNSREPATHQHVFSRTGSHTVAPQPQTIQPPSVSSASSLTLDTAIISAEDCSTVCMASPTLPTAAPNLSHQDSQPADPACSGRTTCNTDIDSDTDVLFLPPEPELAGCDSPVILSSRALAGRGVRGSPSARQPSIFKSNNGQYPDTTDNERTTPKLLAAVRVPQTHLQVPGNEGPRKLLFVTSGDGTAGAQSSSASPRSWKGTTSSPSIPTHVRGMTSPDSPAALRSSLAGWIHTDPAAARDTATAVVPPGVAHPETSSMGCSAGSHSTNHSGGLDGHNILLQEAHVQTSVSPYVLREPVAATPPCFLSLRLQPGSWRAAATRASTRMTAEDLASFDEQPITCLPLSRNLSLPQLASFTTSPNIQQYTAVSSQNEMDHDAIFLIPSPPDAAHPHGFWSPSHGTTPRSVAAGSHLTSRHTLDGADISQRLQSRLLHPPLDLDLDLAPDVDPSESLDATSQLLYPLTTQASYHARGDVGTGSSSDHQHVHDSGSRPAPAPAHSFSLDMSQLLQDITEDADATAASTSPISPTCSRAAVSCVPGLTLTLTPIRTASTEVQQPPSLDWQQRQAAAAATAGLWTPPEAVSQPLLSCLLPLHNQPQQLEVFTCDVEGPPRPTSCPPDLSRLASSSLDVNNPSGAHERFMAMTAEQRSPTFLAFGHSPFRASELFTRLPRIRTSSLGGTPIVELDFLHRCSTPRKDTSSVGVQHSLNHQPDTARPQPGTSRPQPHLASQPQTVVSEQTGTSQHPRQTQPGVSRPQPLDCLPGYHSNAGRPIMPAQYHSQPGTTTAASLSFPHRSAPQGPHSFSSAVPISTTSCTPHSAAQFTAASYIPSLTINTHSALCASMIPEVALVDPGTRLTGERRGDPASGKSLKSLELQQSESAAQSDSDRQAEWERQSESIRLLPVSPLRGGVEAGGFPFPPLHAGRRSSSVAGGFRVRDRRSLVARYVDVFAVEQRR